MTNIVIYRTKYDVKTKEHPYHKAAHEIHEEKDGHPYSEETRPFLRIHRSLVFYTNDKRYDKRW